MELVLPAQGLSIIALLAVTATTTSTAASVLLPVPAKLRPDLQEPSRAFLATQAAMLVLRLGTAPPSASSAANARPATSF